MVSLGAILEQRQLGRVSPVIPLIPITQRLSNSRHIADETLLLIKRRRAVVQHGAGGGMYLGQGLLPC